jgi:hypothetical protein
MKNSLVYPLIVAICTAMLAIVLPRVIVFKSDEPYRIQVKEKTLRLSNAVLTQLLETIPDLDKIIDKNALGWREEYRNVGITASDMLARRISAYGITISEFRLYNQSDQILDVDIRASEGINFFSAAGGRASLLKLGDGPEVPRLLPREERVIFSVEPDSYSSILDKNRVAFFSGNVYFEPIRENRYDFKLSFFGIDPSENDVLTLVAYTISFFILCMFLLSGVFSFIYNYYPNSFSVSTSDEDYVRMIRRLRHVRRTNPKRFRQIIRLYRRRPEEE